MRKAVLSCVLGIALLAGGFVGVMMGSDETAEAAVGPLERMTVPAAAFHPITEGQSWLNGGYHLRGSGSYVAALSFPYEEVRVRRVTLKYLDNEAGANLCLTLTLAVPGQGGDDDLGYVCSSDASAVDPQRASFVVSAPVTGRQGGYLWLAFDTESTALRVYGVTIEYRPIL
jgi:hypothetical protein